MLIVKSDGITVIEQRNEPVTPSAPTNDNVRINMLAFSARNRNGTAAAIVVPVVARSAGIFFLSAQ
jgi:hypothetical protein